jgi:transposase-like protein
MPLSGNLRFVDLTFKCPFCHCELVKTGGWFQTVPGFKCDGCQSQIRLGYSDKVALFQKHAHLA